MRSYFAHDMSDADVLRAIDAPHIDLTIALEDREEELVIHCAEEAARQFMSNYTDYINGEPGATTAPVVHDITGSPFVVVLRNIVFVTGTSTAMRKQVARVEQAERRKHFVKSVESLRDSGIMSQEQVDVMLKNFDGGVENQAVIGDGFMTKGNPFGANHPVNFGG